MLLSPKTSNTDEYDDDPWIKIVQSGKCVEEAQQVQECYFDKRDWRLCAEVLNRFRQCWIDKDKKNKLIKEK
ncbi:hypothetical protein T552_00505 [Pneumocystis carinii B80]|uniref:CHCH domain-containing protein n=1 Tax=Pneumocystis carinii (strain B80) TaxID=1408658 RepID=A0A0W4ZQY5_PNEC8|nr:hypothetical protein T552_00505 [Pneumocystis carinii B80]KTW30793.1 hypothetical protein T552_00505 [Pneumocystis carinii B80]